MNIDAHCFKIFCDWYDGKIGESEAKKLMQEHGDRNLFEMLNNGFSTALKVDEKDWEKVTGSIGTT